MVLWSRVCSYGPRCGLLVQDVISWFKMWPNGPRCVFFGPGCGRTVHGVNLIHSVLLWSKVCSFGPEWVLIVEGVVLLYSVASYGPRCGLMVQGVFLWSRVCPYGHRCAFILQGGHLWS